MTIRSNPNFTMGRTPCFIGLAHTPSHGVLSSSNEQERP
jgi:hypothetical protein